MLPTSNKYGRILSGIILIIALAAIACPASAENGWITGTVSESGGTIFGIPIPGDPISGATVQPTGTAYTATTNADGEYNLSVPAGNYTLFVSARGFNSKTSGTVKVTAGNTTSMVDIVLEKPSGNLTGTVTDLDDGTPVSFVMISYPTGGLLPPSAITDTNGKYTITGLPVGTLTMNLTALPPYNSYDFTVDIKNGKITTKDIQLKAICSIYVILKGSDGKPLEGATVTAGSYSGTTDGLGMCTLDVKPGVYTVEIKAPGYETGKKQVTVSKGSPQMITAQLPKSAAAGGATTLLLVLVVVVIAAVAGIGGFMFLKKRKKAAAQAAGAPGAGMAPAAPGAPGQPSMTAGPGGQQGIPPPPKTQEEKMKDWADYERMYGRPHPEAPGWITNPATLHVVKPKCPVDDVVVSFEPYSGQYFCSKCRERYPAERVFPPGQMPAQGPPGAPPVAPPPQFGQPTYGVPPGPAGAPGGLPPPPPQPQAAPAPTPPETDSLAPQVSPYASLGHQEQPSWSTQTVAAPSPPPPPPQQVYIPPALPQPPAQPPAAPPAPPPKAAPVEAEPVSGVQNVLEASLVHDNVVPPNAGPVFNLPPPKDYDAETEQRPPSGPAEKPPEGQ